LHKCLKSKKELLVLKLDFEKDLTPLNIKPSLIFLEQRGLEKDGFLG
jgi:hypothetical protein